MATTFAMDTLVTQQAYGPNAQAAMRQVNQALADYSARLSMFQPESDIARVNSMAGTAPVRVQPATASLLQQALALSAQSEGAFAVSIAPLTLAWGVTSGKPRIPSADEISALLPLVDDTAVKVDGDTVYLPWAGMGLDLGGIAKGAACGLIADIYRENGITSAFADIGGNIYAHGRKPDGSPFRFGFVDPDSDGTRYIASFTMEDAVIAVSGGYNRYFEVDGQRYIHILNPTTGMPAESDIVSVGVIATDGAEADFYSTTLFIWGRQRALAYMEAGGTAIILDDEDTLYVSECLREGFELTPETATQYSLIFV